MQYITAESQPEVNGEGIRLGNEEIGWQNIVKLLPANLEEQAYQCGAISRRRNIRSALALLQMIVVYVMMDWSLRQVGIWGVLYQVCAISDVAILKRLRQSAEWLEQLVAHMLGQRLCALPPTPVRVRLCDATTLCCPGSKWGDWRVHVSLNLAEMQVDALTLTDIKGSEGLHHFAAAPGEILVADRAYGYVNSLTQVLANASCVVRVRWTDLATYTHQGKPFLVTEWLRHTFATEVLTAQQVELQVQTPQQTFSLRLIACPLPPVQAEQARVRLRKQAQKRQSQVMPESLLVAGYVLLVTNLPPAQWSPTQVSELYRLRWQVELYFKRLKGIMHLDHLRAHDPQLARTYLLGKLLLALVLDHHINAVMAQVPTWAFDLTRPLSIWRLTALLWHGWQMSLTHQLLHLLAQVDPRCLRRYLCAAPRKRQQQATLARLFVRSLSVVNVLPA